jgi:hypothetical protein
MRSGLTNVPRRCVPGTPRLSLGVIRASSHLNQLAVILQHLPSKPRGSERAPPNPHVEKTIRLRVHETPWVCSYVLNIETAERTQCDGDEGTHGTFAIALCSCSRGIRALGELSWTKIG